MSFQEIKGQDTAIRFIQSVLRENRLSNAYLFIGPKGVGKSFFAKNLAKAINCLKQDFDACDNCESCLKIENLNHPDIHYLEPPIGGTIRIEQMRQLQEQVNLKPFEARKKVFLIKEIDTMTAEAANCFLKTLEEPPQNTIFLLSTSKLNAIFSTIISRCQKIYFGALRRHDLENILNKEYGLDAKTSHYLAYFNEGRLSDALELKDEDILAQKNRIIDSLFFHNQDQEIQLDDRQEAIKALQVILSWIRDIYLLKTGLADEQLIHLDRRGQVYNLANRFSFFQLEQIIQLIDNYILYLDENVNLKLILNSLKEKLWTR